VRACRARLESLAALLDVPASAAAQLLLKHSALGAIPPNVTITRAKQMSLALRCSMARAAELIAKVGVRGRPVRLLTRCWLPHTHHHAR
jgi:hypothetical protein